MMDWDWQPLRRGSCMAQPVSSSADEVNTNSMAPGSMSMVHLASSGAFSTNLNPNSPLLRENAGVLNWLTRSRVTRASSQRALQLWLLPLPSSFVQLGRGGLPQPECRISQFREHRWPHNPIAAEHQNQELKEIQGPAGVHFPGVIQYGDEL